MNNKEELKRNSINVHQRLGTDVQITAEEMDNERYNTKTYDYLCRLEEAKSWIGEICTVPESYEEFEEEMRKGLYLAEVAKFYSPSSVKSIFMDNVLQYRHTDNINFFLKALSDLGLPKYFYFEVIDLYEKKNFPKVVYCIHALAHYLNVQGISSGIKSAAGKVFEKSDIDRMDLELENVKLPQFDNIHQEFEKHVDDVKKELRAKLLEEEEYLSNINAPNYEEEEDLLIESNERPNYNILKLKFRTFLNTKAFNDIYYKKNVSLFSIRKFLFSFFKKSREMIKESAINEIQDKINKKLTEIFEKENVIDCIENRLKLLLHNKVEVNNIKYKPRFQDNYNLKIYEEVFTLLQTDSRYLTEILNNVEEKDEFINEIVIPLFSNVRGKKEEYFFIHLVLNILYLNNDLLREDINYLCTSDTSYKLMIGYFRVSLEGEYFKKGFYEIVKKLDSIEIECNPSEIYRELYGIVKSLDESLENKRVRELYETRLSVIRDVIKSIFDFIENNISSIPFILRYYIKIYGSERLFKDFLFPFFLAVDAFDETIKVSKSLKDKIYKVIYLIDWIIDSSTKKCNTKQYCETYNIIAEKCNTKDSKMCNIKESTAVGDDSSLKYSKQKDFLISDNFPIKNSNQSNNHINNLSDMELNREKISEISVYIPIIDSLKEISKKYSNILNCIVSVSSLDNYFQTETINELVRIKKSIVYLKVKQVNTLVNELYKIKDINTHFEDLVNRLEYLPEDNNFTLTFKLSSPNWELNMYDGTMGLSNYINNAKKKIIYLLKICKGRKISDLVKKNNDPREYELFELIKSCSTLERRRNNMEEYFKEKEVDCADFIEKNDDYYNAVNYLNQYDDLINLEYNLVEESLDQLKDNLLDDLSFLESKGVISEKNGYFELLSLIANDIILLKYMSLERSKELKVNELTYSNLLKKEEYLQSVIREYEEYYESYTSRMIRKNNYNMHEIIRKYNKESKYGSLYLSSEYLTERNILKEVKDLPSLEDVFFILSCERPMEFLLEMYLKGVPGAVEPVIFRFEDLLYKRSCDESVISFGTCDFYTKGLLDLLNEKYIVN